MNSGIPFSRQKNRNSQQIAWEKVPNSSFGDGDEGGRTYIVVVSGGKIFLPIVENSLYIGDWKKNNLLASSTVPKKPK